MRLTVDVKLTERLRLALRHHCGDGSEKRFRALAARAVEAWAAELLSEYDPDLDECPSCGCPSCADPVCMGPECPHCSGSLCVRCGFEACEHDVCERHAIGKIDTAGTDSPGALVCSRA